MILDAHVLPSPCYVVDEGLLTKNLQTLSEVAKTAGCKILLAQKAFSMFCLYPLIGEYLDGTTASGLHEAKLSRDYMGKENHVFSAAYSDAEFDAILPVCSHIVFNSFSQWDKFKNRAQQWKKSFGMRINPEISTQGGGIYDPCAPGSRLGVTAENFRFNALDGLDGIHFHTLCQQNADALEATLQAAEEKFSACFKQISWLNMGGGHHITREDYDRERLVRIIKNFKKKYDLEIYLEPGEAVALNAGFLVCTVLDIINNGGKIAILDTSAACHMPDVLEMPYRPRLIGAEFSDGKNSKNAKNAKKFAHTYRLGGPTCLAGDFIGEYSFPTLLKPGERLIFEDMAIYSMVKNNTFNGINLPAIAIRKTSGEIHVVRRFGYEDFCSRLS
ncbi:MAG: carboxynorspermidine decarboxylase [Defluviitaleaceae bacterium]|nr:carboxynorspermidine decarboxylase [Defluviitaleaceae bacterium]